VCPQHQGNRGLTRNYGSRLRAVFWQGWLALKSKPLRIPLPIQIDISALPRPKRFAQ